MVPAARIAATTVSARRWTPPQAEAGHAEIMQFASNELGAERAEELRQTGAALPLDSFTAFDR
jgi:hypothetical protein